MFNNLPTPLPGLADRQKIIEQAKLVLTEARIIVEHLDRSFARLSAEWPGQYPNPAALAFMPADAAVAFRAD